MTTRGVNFALPDVDATGSSALPDVGARGSFASPDVNARGLMETRGWPSVPPGLSRLTA
jgi:hypothetical protein